MNTTQLECFVTVAENLNFAPGRIHSAHHPAGGNPPDRFPGGGAGCQALYPHHPLCKADARGLELSGGRQEHPQHDLRGQGQAGSPGPGGGALFRASAATAPWSWPCFPRAATNARTVSPGAPVHQSDPLSLPAKPAGRGIHKCDDELSGGARKKGAGHLSRTGKGARLLCDRSLPSLCRPQPPIPGGAAPGRNGFVRAGQESGGHRPGAGAAHRLPPAGGAVLYRKIPPAP